MFGGDLAIYAGSILVAILGFLGVYARGQHYKIKSLEHEKKEVEAVANAEKRRADTNMAKAKLHKEVARDVIKHNDIAKKKVEEIQEKIDAVKDGQEFTVSI